MKIKANLRKAWRIAKLVWTAYKTYREVRKMRKGVKTSEFWLTVLTVIGMLIPVLQGTINPETWAIISGVLVGAYTIARAVVKATASKEDDRVLRIVWDKIIRQIDDTTEPPDTPQTGDDTDSK
ncbi:MAG: hypothetical protein J7L56_03445 [Halomonas sp.]|nr:hypothetical protein [Halomonas sp.]MCD6437306.1 hypothetical protein [Halomonas sp.]